jgi:transcriptional regulator with XRE-family HTH domain
MSSRRLPQYLITHRKRAGFSHEELAFLLGCTWKTIARYELGARTPSLETALGYEAVFGVAVSELFAGVFEETEREVITRAKVLLAKLQDVPYSPLIDRKCALLRAIAFGPDIIAENS